MRGYKLLATRSNRLRNDQPVIRAPKLSAVVSMGSAYIDPVTRSACTDAPVVISAMREAKRA